MNNGRCVLLIIFDESDYTQVIYTFSKLDNTGKKEKLLNLFNDLNEKYKLLKFYIDEKDEIIAKYSYVSLVDKFDADLFVDTMIGSFLSIQNDEYAKIMRLLWS